METLCLSDDVSEQIKQALAVIDRHLAGRVLGIHLYGSAVDGGLKPNSDIDLLVTVRDPLSEAVRRALMLDLLTVSSPMSSDGTVRPLEVTVIVHGDVIPWRYPPRRELQYGEWLRQDIQAGNIETAVVDHDLAILLTKVRKRSVALMGPPADTFFDPIPWEDVIKGLQATAALWNSEEDWQGDERNIILTLARIWYSATTKEIVPKDVAAAWLLQRVPEQHRSIVADAWEGYLGTNDDDWSTRNTEMAAFVSFAKANIEKMLKTP